MPSIRQQVNIAAAPRAVWRALTTEQGLTSWLVTAARVDPRPGGRLVLTTAGADGAPVEERGMFHDIRPTRRIEIAFDANSPSSTRGTRLELHVAVDGGETRVLLVHSGEALGDAEVSAVQDARWRQALLALRESFEGHG
jgi:uncharacterized protein YndB with AHSA1/START domain